MVQDNNIILFNNYKDHTVINPVTSLKIHDLPDNAYQVHNQMIRNLSVTIQILDEQTERVLETITGKASGGNVDVLSESLIRREASIILSLAPELFPSPDSLIWFKKFCRIYVGIEDNATREPVNFLIGTFWIDDVGYELSSTTHELTVKVKDKMSKWDNELEYPMTINVGTPIHEAIRAIMEHIGETSFGQIDESKEHEVVPYTIKYNVGDKILDLVIELRDMYMDYICGYDVMGRFEFRKIETQKEDLLETPKWRFDAQDTTLKTMLSFSENYNLTNIKNRIVVYGGTSEVTGLTPVGESRITSLQSPFNIDAIGERTKIIIEPKYVTNEQCIAMARYTAYKSSNFQEQAAINTVPIYFLDVFDIIDVKHPYTRVESKYLVDRISFGLDVSATMNISAHKLYYVTLEYGSEYNELVQYIKNGIIDRGWIYQSETLIKDAFNIQGSGSVLNIHFVDHLEGGWQAATTSYPTTKVQTLEFDLSDFKELDMTSILGDYIPESRRNNDDAISRIIAHEMVHVVMNDYLGYDKVSVIPEWFKEGMSELIHGAGQGRFDSVFLGKSNADKKDEIIRLAEWLLNGNFDGTSEDYVASFMLAWAVYRLAKRNNLWHNLFYRLRETNNISLNFLSKLLPIASTPNEVKGLIMKELREMSVIWNYFFSTTKPDTGSVLGILGENKYGMALEDENILRIEDFQKGNESLGFKLKFIK